MPEPTWRDETPRAVQDDLDALAQAAFDDAERLLGVRRDFAPFAVALDPGGRRCDVAGGPGAEPLAVLTDLRASVRRRREDYRAVGFVALVFVRTGDAVRVELEHRDGGPALVLLRPCRVGRLRRANGSRVAMGGVTGSFGERLVWPDAS